HLLGYDHQTPEDEAKMRQKQREILERVGLGER
ncbi:MAG: rRNA maturation RNAse YbeY, partial [Thermacetogeniaceae bacterium]